MEAELQSIRRSGSDLLGEAISRVRSGQVGIQPGYDGEFGTIRLIDSQERDQISGQLGLFEAKRKINQLLHLFHYRSTLEFQEYELHPLPVV